MDAARIYVAADDLPVEITKQRVGGALEIFKTYVEDCKSLTIYVGAAGGGSAWSRGRRRRSAGPLTLWSGHDDRF